MTISSILSKTRWWQPAAVVFLALLYSYWPIIQSLYHQMMINDNYSGGLLVVPISAYLIWDRRKRLEKLELKPDWRAVSALILAVAIFTAGELGAELFTTRVSLLVFVVGSVWLLFGAAALKTLRFPLAFLFLMLPLPGFVYRNLTFPLQLLSSVLSVELLQLAGVSVYRQGNVIDMGFTQLQVVEACNGLRYILPLLTMGVLLAFLSDKKTWKRLVLIVACIPIALLANVVRIAGTGLASLKWGPEAAEGFFHAFSGWIVFMSCFGLFLLVNFVLDKIPPRRAPGAPQPENRPAAPAPKGADNSRWMPAVVAALFVFATPAMVGHLGNVPPVPLNRPLDQFPRQYDNWQGRAAKMEDRIWDRVGGQDYVIIDYFKAGAPPVNFYTAYYEYQKKAGDFIHSPKLCLPGAGWYIQQNHVRKLAADHMAPNAGNLVFNELLIQKDDTRQLTYFWYQGRGRNFTNEYLAKFYMVWDGALRRRTDGALVRLIREIGPDETAADARSVLDPFALFVSRTLMEYLPE